MLVEHDDRGQLGHGRPRRGPGADHDGAPAAAARPVPRARRATGTPARRSRAPSSRAWSTDGVTTSVSPRAAAASTTPSGSAAGGSRSTARADGRAPSAAKPVERAAAPAPVRRGRGREAGHRRRAATPWPGRLRSGPAQRHAAHDASSTTSGGGPQPVTLAIGFSATPAGGVVAEGDDPAADPAAVQRDAHDRADPHPSAPARPGTR